MKNKRTGKFSLDPWGDWQRLLVVFGFILLGSLLATYLGLRYMSALVTGSATSEVINTNSSVNQRAEIIKQAVADLRAQSERFARWQKTPPPVIDPGRAGL